MANLVPVTKQDTLRHQPGPDNDPFWQESFFLGWCDAQNRCGG